MGILPVILLPFTAYLLGSISFARWIAGMQGVDVTERGSRNPGATNVSRTVSTRAGRLVLLFDVTKGFLPTAFAAWWLGSASLGAAVTGLAAVLGHVFPAFHRFHGGKGVATGFGMLLALAPTAAATAVAAFVLLRFATKVTSIASVGAAGVGAVAAVSFHGFAYPSMAAWMLTVFFLWTHRSNWRELFGKGGR